MIERKYKKLLIFGIFILFLGTAIAPNISGYDNKADIKSIRESATSMPLNDDDFINAYWKFDECSGNTVGDSSSPSYDGVRYGATWITNGYSGCALEFDGVDDYVDLSTHSKKIGINKTDDFIISFYFKTSSDNPGIIYSATGYKNIPEFRIELLSNGSLLFKIWTTLCGLSMTTSGTHNDGSWHFIKIYFNGITTDPTIEIFIDNSLDATLTDWLCEIESVDWLATAFGRRASEDTRFFDGILDEFKFIKYEGGNEQEPPEVSGPGNGDPETDIEYTFTTNDPEGDEVWIKIDWGDGEITDWLGPYDSGEPATYSHSWDDEGAYLIKTKSQDRWHYSAWSGGYEVRIGNQAPNPPTITGPKHGDPDQQLTYTFIADDFEHNDIYYIIDWDDGTKTETDYVQSNTPIELSHSWGTENDYNITAQAVDEHEKLGEESEPYLIRIGDEPPRKPDIDGPINGPAGVEIDFMFTTTDPETDKVCFNIKWGDGEEITETAWFNSGQTATISHIWENTGTYIVEARAKDMFEYWSTWESYQIKIPRNKAISYNILELLFEQFPNVFPIFRYIIGM